MGGKKSQNSKIWELIQKNVCLTKINISGMGAKKVTKTVTI